VNVHRLPLGRGHKPNRPNNLKLAERITQRERDPELDMILVAITKANISLETVADRSNVAISTINRWYKKTTRPHNYTLNQVWEALGYDTTPRLK
jgi:hypothetical protein